MATEFHCRQCGRVLQAGEAPAGRRILCPGCGSFSTVPGPAAGQVVEFRCPQCGKLLQTPGDSAGKQAKCPECGAVTTVPPVSTGPQVEAGPQDETLPHVPPPPPPPSPGDRPGGPFAPGGPEASDVENPYQSPIQYGQPAHQGYAAASPLASSRVSGPAVGLIVTGVIGLPFAIIAVLLNLMGVGFGAFHGELQVMPVVFSSGVKVALNLIGIIFSILVIIGAVKMKNLENYGFAMAASIIAIVPCISPCCVLGLPFGIWALVVLSDAQVKAAFRS